MFHKIMVPIDLEQIEMFDKALALAATMAKQSDAEVCFVSAANTTPGAVAPTPSAFAAALESFARKQAENRGVKASARAVEAKDVAADLTDILVDAVDDLGADLVVMATHAPHFADHFFAAHGASVAARTGASVFLVR